MPANFTDLPFKYDVLQTLAVLSKALKANGIIFDKQVDGTTVSERIDEASVKIRRLWLLQELYLNEYSASTHITCDTCADCTTCRSAFDMYNIDGDCLEEK